MLKRGCNKNPFRGAKNKILRGKRYKREGKVGGGGGCCDLLRWGVVVVGGMKEKRWSSKKEMEGRSDGVPFL